MIHKTILRSDEIFYGWPANNGAWQWDDEMLFGVMAGRRQGQTTSMHKVAGPLAPFMVRSTDGGMNWSSQGVYLEHAHPGEDWEPLLFTGQGELHPWPADMADRIIRVCGFYDHGGEGQPERGAFYSSADRGLTWDGPHEFAGLDLTEDFERRCTARTCVLGDLVFLSTAHELEWGTDKVRVVRMCNDHFEPIRRLPDVEGRQVMPSAVRLGDTIIVACRRLIGFEGFIDIYRSDDDGATWRIVNPRAADTGRHNGNPPALLAVGDSLVFAYGNRDDGCMRIALSSDKGETWVHMDMRRNGGRDFGYPRLFRRTDGVVVCVYYWFGGIEMTELTL